MSDTLRCSTCQRDLPDDDFSMGGWRKRRFRYYECRECASARGFLRDEQIRQVVQAAKDVPCMDCGVRYPLCATDFDHRDPSKKAFNLNKARSHSLQNVKDEMAKCDVVCSNCHAVRTHKRRLQALQRGETAGCLVPRGTRRSPKTQTPSLPAPLPDEPTLFDTLESR